MSKTRWMTMVVGSALAVGLSGAPAFAEDKPAEKKEEAKKEETKKEEKAGSKAAKKEKKTTEEAPKAAP